MTHECPHCDRSFDSEAGLWSHKGQAHKHPWQDKELFRELYVEKGLNCTEMGERWDCTKNTVCNWRVKHGFKKQFVPPRLSFERSREQVGGEYVRVGNWYDGREDKTFIHRIIAVANGDLAPSEYGNMDKVVHHKSRHGLDNRHGNLEVLTQREHMIRHESWKFPQSD